MQTAIKNFLVKSLTDKTPMSGAILLTGGWGSGKTHFIENTLIPVIKRKGKKAIYISLFGRENLNEIKNTLKSKAIINLSSSAKTDSIDKAVNNIKAVVKFGAKMASGYVKEKTNVDPAELIETFVSGLDSLEFLPQNSIIILDDFERCKCQDLVYGLISQLVEVQKCRVLVLANFQEIGDLKYQEKSFQRIISFKSGIEPAYDAVLKKYANKSTKKYLSNPKIYGRVVVNFEYYKCDNVRTFIKLVSYLNEISSHGIDLPLRHLSFLIEFLIFKSEFGKLVQVKEVYQGSYEHFTVLKIEDEKNAYKKEELKTTLQPLIEAAKAFRTRFNLETKHPDRKNEYIYFFSDSLFDFLATDILNADKLSAELAPATNNNELYKINEKITGRYWALYTQKEVEKIYDDLQTALTKKIEIGSTELLNMYIHFLMMFKVMERDITPLRELFEKYIDNSSMIRKTTVSEHLFRTSVEADIVDEANNLVKKIEAIQNNFQVFELKAKVIKAIKENDLLFFQTEEFSHNRRIYREVCTDNDVLTLADKSFENNPRTFNDFYRKSGSILDTISNSSGAKKVLSDRIGKLKTSYSDDKIRTYLLNELISEISPEPK